MAAAWLIKNDLVEYYHVIDLKYMFRILVIAITWDWC